MSFKKGDIIYIKKGSAKKMREFTEFNRLDELEGKCHVIHSIFADGSIIIKCNFKEYKWALPYMCEHPAKDIILEIESVL